MILLDNTWTRELDPNDPQFTEMHKQVEAEFHRINREAVASGKFQVKHRPLQPPRRRDRPQSKLPVAPPPVPQEPMPRPRRRPPGRPRGRRAPVAPPQVESPVPSADSPTTSRWVPVPMWEPPSSTTLPLADTPPPVEIDPFDLVSQRVDPFPVQDYPLSRRAPDEDAAADPELDSDSPDLPPADTSVSPASPPYKPPRYAKADPMDEEVEPISPPRSPTDDGADPSGPHETELTVDSHAADSAPVAPETPTDPDPTTIIGSRGQRDRSRPDPKDYAGRRPRSPRKEQGKRRAKPKPAPEPPGTSGRIRPAISVPISTDSFDDYDEELDDDEPDEPAQDGPSPIPTPSFRPARPPGERQESSSEEEIDPFSSRAPGRRVQPPRKAKKMRTKPKPLEEGIYDLTPEERRALFEQADSRYRDAHRRHQKKYGLNSFSAEPSPHFDPNEAVPLNPDVFDFVCAALDFTPTIDLFADNNSNRCERFLTARPSTGSCGVNAFNYSWKDERGYANPPWSLLPRVLRKICIERCRVLLVFPEWPRAAWYPVARQLETRTLLWTESCYMTVDYRPRPAPKWSTRFSVVDGARASSELFCALDIHQLTPLTVSSWEPEVLSDSEATDQPSELPSSLSLADPSGSQSEELEEPSSTEASSSRSVSDPSGPPSDECAALDDTDQQSDLNVNNSDDEDESDTETDPPSIFERAATVVSKIFGLKGNPARPLATP